MWLGVLQVENTCNGRAVADQFIDPAQNAQELWGSMLQLKGM